MRCARRNRPYAEVQVHQLLDLHQGARAPVALAATPRPAASAGTVAIHLQGMAAILGGAASARHGYPFPPQRLSYEPPWAGLASMPNPEQRRTNEGSMTSSSPDLVGWFIHIIADD